MNPPLRAFKILLNPLWYQPCVIRLFCY